MKPVRISHNKFFERVDVITHLLACLYDEESIIRIARNRWGVRKDAAKRYIAAARARMVEIATGDRQDQLARSVQFYAEVIRRHMRGDNGYSVKDALDARKQLDRVLGLDQSEAKIQLYASAHQYHLTLQQSLARRMVEDESFRRKYLELMSDVLNGSEDNELAERLLKDEEFRTAYLEFVESGGSDEEIIDSLSPRAQRTD